MKLKITDAIGKEVRELVVPANRATTRHPDACAGTCAWIRLPARPAGGDRPVAWRRWWVVAAGGGGGGGGRTRRVMRGGPCRSRKPATCRRIRAAARLGGGGGGFGGGGGGLARPDGVARARTPSRSSSTARSSRRKPLEGRHRSGNADDRRAAASRYYDVAMELHEMQKKGGPGPRPQGDSPPQNAILRKQRRLLAGRQVAAFLSNESGEAQIYMQALHRGNDSLGVTGERFLISPRVRNVRAGARRERAFLPRSPKDGSIRAARHRLGSSSCRTTRATFHHRRSSARHYTRGTLVRRIGRR